ncbi:MAG: hypothetical protein A2Y63_02310 [Candidatus Riflebacteria bacterium RBG_13_59_9]|nr:MAG: hypothetical protein A2Y63_02310 [Candidatus Riflebacteria bacterium RBG_13_59_9]
MENEKEMKPRSRASLFGHLLIILSAVALVAVLVLLARAPGRNDGRQIAGYQPPRVLPAINPADEDAIAVLKTALESADPQTAMNAARRLPYLAIPELKEGMKALKDLGLMWDYIQVIPELHYLGDERAEDDLRGYLASADLQTVMSALETLERMPPMSCRDELLDALRQPHMDMAIGGSKVLKAWRKSDEEINEVLLNIMRNAPVDFSQVAAAAALYNLNVEKEAAWEVIRHWSENADMELAPTMVTFLKYCDHPQAGETMALMLRKNVSRTVTLGGLVNLDWPGKMELVDAQKEKASTYDSYLIMVNHQASEGHSDLNKIITQLLEEPQVEEGPGTNGGDSGDGETPVPPGNKAKAEMATSASRDMRIASLNTLLLAVGQWDSPRAIPFLEKTVSTNAARLLRMETSRILRKFENNRRAGNLARQLLELAQDERELREHATTLGYIDNRRAVARLHELMLSAEEPDTKLTLAWAIVNINRGHPHKYPQR